MESQQQTSVPKNIQPVTNLQPGDLPEGFTAIDPSAAASKTESAAQAEQKQSILQQVLTPEALARLGRIKLVNQARATQVENGIVALAMSGKLQGQINEAKLVELLERSSRQNAGAPVSVNIQRKKYAFDSDDSDNDDDI